MNQKCCINGCKNEIGFIESALGIKHCDECERLLMSANKEKINTSLCKDKKDLIEVLKNKK
ncbi:MAG: hypothetical protein AAB925_01155 [Patescibacteria group bacterium]